MGTSMAPREEGGGSGRGPRSKVDRLIDEYGLTGMGAELERRWTGAGDGRSSLRELADLFNARLVRSAMERADVSPLSGEASNVYELLTAEGTSVGERTQARRSLEREGVEVADLEDDFVSHQAIHTYLTKHRGAAAPDDGRDAAERGLERIQRLRGRTTAVTEHTVEQLRRAGELDLDEFSVFVDLRVVCDRCGTAYTVEETFENGGCRCAAE
jgi:hypothetical protein